MPIFNEKERVKARHLRAVIFDQPLPDRTLHWREHESTGWVSFDDKIDSPVAEITHTIKDHDVAIIHSISKKRRFS
jgi:hypothetical protein